MLPKEALRIVLEFVEQQTYVSSTLDEAVAVLKADGIKTDIQKNRNDYHEELLRQRAFRLWLTGVIQEHIEARSEFDITAGGIAKAIVTAMDRKDLKEYEDKQDLYETH